MFFLNINTTFKSLFIKSFFLICILFFGKCYFKNITKLLSIDLAIIKENFEMDSLNCADIDEKGKFKYILLEIKNPSTQDKKLVVTGYRWAGYHADLYEAYEKKLIDENLKNLRINCLGGGKLIHKPEEKSIEVIGFSYQFGHADRNLVADVLRTKFIDYNVIVSTDQSY